MTDELKELETDSWELDSSDAEYVALWKDAVAEYQAHIEEAGFRE